VGVVGRFTKSETKEPATVYLNDWSRAVRERSLEDLQGYLCRRSRDDPGCCCMRCTRCRALFSSKATANHKSGLRPGGRGHRRNMIHQCRPAERRGSEDFKLWRMERPMLQCQQPAAMVPECHADNFWISFPLLQDAFPTIASVGRSSLTEVPWKGGR
jgi:hypothetical protein